jgi:hypothetical protein
MSIQVNQPLRERLAELAGVRGISQNRLIVEMLTSRAWEKTGEVSQAGQRRLA